MIPGFETLIDTVDVRLRELGIDEKTIKLDHVGYKASSMQDYEAKKLLAAADAALVHESEVGGTMVAIFKFAEPKTYRSHMFVGFEVVGPKIDEQCRSFWEHVEYVINEPLDDFAARYKNIGWNLSAINRPKFPKIAIRFDDGLSAKFHCENVLEEVKMM